MEITFHFVPEAYWKSCDPQSDYIPAAFKHDGFIHCTDGAEEMADVANRYYGGEQASALYLLIDKERVRAPIRYEDPAHIYPHIYGPLNRDAIAGIWPARRDPAGRWHAPSDTDAGSEGIEVKNEPRHSRSTD